MTKLTSYELSLIESRPHRTKLWLSIYQPTTVFQAQINNPSAAQGDRSLPYDGVLFGVPGNVNDGMTMYVGSTPGASDKGRIRVKSIVTGTVNVAENSYINWEDDNYLTIVDFYEINAKYPRIISDPGDATKTIWYKDYDIEYTNQNTVQGAFPCMGSHFAGFIEDDGFCDVWYTSSGTSHVVSGVNLTYYWKFNGATGVTGSTSANPGWITYNTPGHYTTQLIVSGSNGSSDISYRHVSIYKRPEQVANITDSTAPIPIMEWELDKLSGSHEGGGYTASIRLLQNVAENRLRDGSLIVIFGDNWYGSTKQSIGGNIEHRQDILFTGYVINGTIKFDYNSKEMTFDVGSPTEIMKLCDSFSISVEDIDDPAAQALAHPDYYVSPWTLLAGMTVNKAVHHYLKWHSTVLNCCDLRFRGDTDKKIQYFDADRTSLYSAIQTLMKGAVYGYWGSDRQGCLWAETEYYTEASRNNNSFVVGNQDWVGQPTIDEVLTPEVSYLEAGGIQYQGYTSTGTTSVPLLSAAPGESPGYKGTIQRFQGLALTSQSQLNTLVGSVFSYMNRRYPRISFDLSGNYTFFDISPEEEFTLNIPSDKNPRGLAISIKAFINQISYSYRPKQEMLQSKISCSQIPTPITASTLAIPPIPPSSGDNGGIVLPPIVIPPISGGGGAGLSVLFVPAIATEKYGGEITFDRLTHYSRSIGSGNSPGPQLQYESPWSIAAGQFAIPNGASAILVTPVFSSTYAGGKIVLSNQVDVYTLNTENKDSYSVTNVLVDSSDNFVWTDSNLNVSFSALENSLCTISTWRSYRGDTTYEDELRIEGWMVYFS